MKINTKGSHFHDGAPNFAGEFFFSCFFWDWFHLRLSVPCCVFLCLLTNEDSCYDCMYLYHRSPGEEICK